MKQPRALAGISLLLALVAAGGDKALATPYVLVSNQSTGSVLKIDAVTGEFLGTFASHPGITNTQNVTIGPDGLLYVADANSGVYRFDAFTGNFIDLFIDASSAGLDAPIISAIFGPDANLYVTSNTTVRRYHGTTGAPIDIFATSPTGEGVYYPLTFGPDGNLYAGTRFPHKIERFDGASGSYIDLFIPPGLDSRRPGPCSLETEHPGGAASRAGRTRWLSQSPQTASSPRSRRVRGRRFRQPMSPPRNGYCLSWMNDHPFVFGSFSVF
jgi:WD40 repeat protein